MCDRHGVRGGGREGDEGEGEREMRGRERGDEGEGEGEMRGRERGR